MAECQVGGIGWIPNPLPPPNPPDDLWMYCFQTPPVQNSLIVYNNGTVTEGHDFLMSVINGPDVYVFIRGGTNFLVEQGSWLAGVLEAAGYYLICPGVPGGYTAEYESVYT